MSVLFVSSNKDDGNMSVNWGDSDEVWQNRQEFLTKKDLKLEKSVLMNVSDHSDRWLFVDDKDAGMGIKSPAPKVDCLITTAKNLPLLLITADCYPVVIYDKNESILGLVHLGWRGVDQDLIQKVITAMAERSGIKPDDIIIRLGPGIAAHSYVVKSPSQLDNPAWTDFITHVSGDDYQIDLPSFIKKQGVDCGVKIENIDLPKTDTASNKKQFSHYRAIRTGEVEGRFMTVAALQN